MFYFFFAYKQLYKKHKNIIFSVPSGNFGNICAGVLAQKLGLPIKHFIASTNINDTVSHYLKRGKYHTKYSKSNIYKDVYIGNTSNFVRIQKLFDNDQLKKVFSSFSDHQTRQAIKKNIYKNKDVLLIFMGLLDILD